MKIARITAIIDHCGCIIKDLCGLQLSKTKQWLEQESEEE